MFLVSLHYFFIVILSQRGDGVGVGVVAVLAWADRLHVLLLVLEAELVVGRSVRVHARFLVFRYYFLLDQLFSFGELLLFLWRGHLLVVLFMMDFVADLNIITLVIALLSDPEVVGLFGRCVLRLGF